MKKASILFLCIVIVGIIFLIKDRSINLEVENTIPSQDSNIEQSDFLSEVKPILANDDIVIESIGTNGAITSPITIRGKARGTFFFEASFPVTLVNWDGLIIAEAPAQAEGEWMTTEFVPFSVTLTFDASNEVYPRGAIIFQKDNPSGESRFDKAYELPVTFSTQ